MAPMSDDDGASGMDDGMLSAPCALNESHDLSFFDCADAALNDWLRLRALKNESRFSRTYVLCRGGGRVIGYYCISAGSVSRQQAPGRLRRNAPDAVPVSIIGRLAVDRRHSGRGLGGDLLQDALLRIVRAAQVIGMGAVLVHAKDESARRFYLRHAPFIEYPADSRTLFLPIEQIRLALES